MGKILHLIPDEKVTDNVIENFNKVFDDNIFFVLGDKDKRKYCKSVGSNIIFGNHEFFVKENIPSDVKGIVIHGLNFIFANMVRDVNEGIKIAWFAWGYDIYFLPKFNDQLYGRETYKYLIKSDKKSFLIRKIKRNRILRKIYYTLFLKTDDYYAIYENIHNNVRFFCTYIKEDYEMFCSKYRTSAEFFDIGYFSIKQYLGEQDSLRVNENANDVLIGNSNSMECNHLDVIRILSKSKRNLEGKLVLPLNYGNNINYREKVLEDLRSEFNDRFFVLLDFIERKEYFRLVSNCSTAIFYHYRQQAMGNVIAFLYMGGRVYLSKKNPVYTYLKRIGIYVFDMDNEYDIYGSSKLEESKANVNREILNQYFDESVINEQNHILIEKLINVNR